MSILKLPDHDRRQVQDQTLRCRRVDFIFCWGMVDCSGVDIMFLQCFGRLKLTLVSTCHLEHQVCDSVLHTSLRGVPARMFCMIVYSTCIWKHHPVVTKNCYDML